jgi:hypothetical protein
MTTTPNREVAKQPEGLNFHNRRSSTCGSNLSNNCLKGRTDIVKGRTGIVKGRTGIVKDRTDT